MSIQDRLYMRDKKPTPKAGDPCPTSRCYPRLGGRIEPHCRPDSLKAYDGQKEPKMRARAGCPWFSCPECRHFGDPTDPERWVHVSIEEQAS